MKIKTPLYYKANDIPPFLIGLIVSIQHVIAMFAGVIICPLIVASALDFSSEMTLNFISLAIVAAGIGTFLQSFRIGLMGSGFLAIIGSSSTFISVSISAGLQGGIALICGMTFITAPLKIFLSFFAGSLHKFFPAYIRGTMIMLIGISILRVPFQQIFKNTTLFTNTFYLNTIIALVVFTVTVQFSRMKYFMRITSVLAGIVSGCIIAFLAGVYDFPQNSNLPLFMVPQFFHTKLNFSWNHLIPFLIAYFITTLETLGDTYTLTEVSAPPEGRISSSRIRGGIIASGFSSLISGAIGTMASTTYSGNVAIIKMTGVASRVIGIITSIILIIVSFFPFFANVLSSLPKPVIGGSILVAILFMETIGYQIIETSASKKQKRITIFVLAVALFLTFFPQIIPLNFILREVIINPICSCTVLLIVLHLFFKKK